MLYNRRSSTTISGIPSNFSCRNITDEDSSTPFFNVTESSPGLLTGMANVLLDTDSQADGIGTPLINLNIASGYLANATVENSVSAEPGATAITVQLAPCAIGSLSRADQWLMGWGTR